MTSNKVYVRWFEDVSNEDLAVVGGKNASLGQLIRFLSPLGIAVPGGFATTASGYRAFVETNRLFEPIQDQLASLKRSDKSVQEVGSAIRQMFYKSRMPERLAQEIRSAYKVFSRRYGVRELSVAVRSSATAEDLPNASFAGQLESFLNITGEDQLLDACLRCFASLFTDRAIIYRESMGFEHLKVALSVGVQKMVRSDKAGAGVMFSIDPDSGFPRVVSIDAAWGLGESVVGGTVNPDHYLVFKPLLNRNGVAPILEKTLGNKETKVVYSKDGGGSTKVINTPHIQRQTFVLEDTEILALARWSSIIEDHYGKPMDMEWAKDGETGELFIVQARPETVQALRDVGGLKVYRLKEKGNRLLRGVNVGESIVTGKVCIVNTPSEMQRFKPGSILVAEMTDPDWVPIMQQAAGIVTDYGGRTSHAAIVSRELGIPAVLGTDEATKTLQTGQEVTLSCAEGDTGYVYEGRLDFEVFKQELGDISEVRTQIMMNIASPAAAFRWWRLPAKGIGLARMEFIINNLIKIHPMALVRFEKINNAKARRQIESLTRGYADKTEFFIDRLTRGIAKIAASQFPYPVVVRLSDFKTNEYRNLIGGQAFEMEEENPMLGFRGASRYYSEKYREGFALECRALKRVREDIGLDNVVVMIPFCRTPEEADLVLEEMARHGLRRGDNGLQVYVMAEIPSNVIMADEFAKRIDGFSIGSNDLTQLVLGVDRDSSELKHLFDERNEAVKRSIGTLIETAHAHGVTVGICGEAPSNYPDFAQFLVEAGIDSISLNPDSVLRTIHLVAEAERQKVLELPARSR